MSPIAAEMSGSNIDTGMVGLAARMRYRADGIDGHRTPAAAETTMEHISAQTPAGIPARRIRQRLRARAHLRNRRRCSAATTRSRAVLAASIVLAAGATVALSPTTPVLADGGGDLTPDRIQAWVATQPGGGITPAGPSCEAWRLMVRDENSPAWDTALDSRIEADGIVARLHLRRCAERYQLAWIRMETPESLARTVVRELSDQSSRVLPTAELRLSPGGLAVVNLATWLAVEDPAEISITAAVPGQSITVTAWVESTVFDIIAADTDTGASTTTTVECPGTGVIWEPSLADDSARCTHTFTTVPTAPATVSASLIWRGEWRANTGARGDLSTIRGRPNQTELPVVEIVTVGRR